MGNDTNGKESPVLEEISVSDLVFDPRNAMIHTPANMRLIEESIEKHGMARGVVLDENRRILCGNGTIEAAAQLGIERVVVVPSDGRFIVAVERAGLTEEEKIQLALADNRSVEERTWNIPVLMEFAAEGIDMSHLWSDADLEALRRAAQGAGMMDKPEIGEGGDTYGGNAEDAPSRVRRGDLWLLGNHRLKCGDATSDADVMHLLGSDKIDLVTTDPPYGVSLRLEDNHEASKKAKGVNADHMYRHFQALENDDMTDDQLLNLVTEALAISKRHAREHAAWYVWHAQVRQRIFLDAAEAAGINIHQYIVWAKPHFVFGRNDYHWQHEVAWYGWIDGSRPNFYGERNQGTVWETDLGGGAIRSEQYGAAQKPLELYERPIQNHTRPEGIVYDPFAGSGTCIIAAQRTSRFARAMELSATQCNLILDRWLAETGEQPVLASREEKDSAEDDAEDRESD